MWLFTGILLVVCISKASLALPPVILGQIVDAITNPSRFDLASQWWWVGLFLAAGIIQSLVAPVQAIALTGFVQRAVRDASLKWSRKVLEKEFFVFE